MIQFRQKNFSGKAKRAIKWVKENPTLPLSAASVGIASANLGINTKRQREAKEIADKQFRLMNKQMDAISANTKAINDSINSQREVSNIYKEDLKFRKGSVVPQSNSKKKNLFKLFSKEEDTPKKKLFSIKSSTIAGANIGLGLATLGSASGGISNAVSKKISQKTKLNLNDLSKWEKKTAMVAAGTIIGAALGALVGTVDELSKRASRRSVNKRLLPEVISNLKKDNLREGTNYTRDPKRADELKTKVCIAVSKFSGDLRILINTKADPKLKKITDYIVEHIPNTGVDTKTANNKFNEITISTISDSSADATLVSGIAEQFIHSGFPVYLVEVG